MYDLIVCVNSGFEFAKNNLVFNHDQLKIRDQA